MNQLYDVKKEKRGSNQLRKTTKFLSRILMILIYALTSIMYVPAIKVQATANETTDGTYDFDGTVGADNSAGSGIINSKVIATGTTGTFTANLSGLTPNTTYHYRAYATNHVGNQMFTTAALSTNADLSNLSISAGTLTPFFSAGNLSYTASVASNVTSVKVTPTVADGKATAILNGTPIASGVESTDINLNVGVNMIIVVVTAEDGSNKTYTIFVTRAAPTTYTVTYDGNGANEGIAPIDVTNYTQGSSVLVLGNAGNLMKTGYTFSGWNNSADGSGINYAANGTFSMGISNITLYAKWSPNQYMVSFNEDGGSLVTDQTISYLQKATKPADPTKTGYTFGGWYTDSALNTTFDFTTAIITHNTMIYAKWIPNDYTVSFDSNGGSFVSNVTTKYNTTITAPTTPTKVGYTFSEWYKDSSLTNVWDFTTDKVTDNMMLYAKWLVNQVAPIGLMGISPTSSGGSDGKITGTTNLMEYKSSGDPTWITVTGTEIIGLSAGTYQVRYAAKPGFNVGTITNVIVPAYVFSGGGGSSNPSPTVENITGNIDGGHGTNIAQIPITRITETNGTVKDIVTMSDNIAKDVVEKIKGQGIDIVRIVIPDATDKVSETRVNIPKTALSTINNGKVNLEISTENAVISIPTTSLENVNDDLYFRVVPMKTESERQQVEERANSEQVVQKVAKGLKVQVLGRPMMIETNMSNYPVDLVIPLKGVKIPEQADQRITFLNNLGVYIEHSDGEKVFTKVGVVPYKNGELGLKFTVTKFSTFASISIPNTIPTARNVKIMGSPKVGSTLKSSYQYKDDDQDVEGTSLFKWYRADNAAVKNKIEIAGAKKSTYKITSADKGKYISLEVIPVAKTGKSKGVATASNHIGPVKDNTVSKNLTPTVTHLKITGKAIVGRSLKATYTYRDAEKDKQGKSIIQWYRIDPKTKKKAAIKGATKTTYKVTVKDIGKNIVFEVRPIAKKGKIVTSNKTAIVKRAI